MRFLVDEAVSRSVTRYLRSEDHDVLAAVETTPRAVDQDLLGWAEEEDRIVITTDKDFGELVFRSGQTHRGVILLRLKDEGAANQVRMLSVALSLHADSLPGRFTVVSERGIRIHGADLQDQE